MTNYQKAIKLRKVCDNMKTCKDCIYVDNCENTRYLLSPPSDKNIKDIAKAIKEEKWNVK